MYARILVPVDGSDASRCAVVQACRLAVICASTIRLIHVVDAMCYSNGTRISTADGNHLVPAMRRAGRTMLSAAGKVARRHGAAAEGALIQVVSCPVADAIVAEARRWMADVIVMGAHGYRCVEFPMIGSEAASVLRRAGVPIILVRPDAPGEAARAQNGRGDHAGRCGRRLSRMIK